MSPWRFNRILVDVAIGTNRKIRRLSISERWAFIAGVLPLAALSPVRGALLVAEGVPVTARDVAEQAGVTPAVAASSLRALRMLKMLEFDEELGAEWVHDFDDWQSEPRHDPTGADRQKRYRARQKTSRVTANGTVTRDVTGDVSNGGEVKREEKTPPTPPGGDDVTESIEKAQERLKADTLPDDLAGHLHGPARRVHEALLRLHDRKPGSLRPALGAVGRVLASMPDRPHIDVVEDVEHYWSFGAGQNKRCRDLVATYRNRLKTAPVVSGQAHHERSIDDIVAAAERREQLLEAQRRERQEALR